MSSSDIMISYWQNFTRKTPRLRIDASALVAERHTRGPRWCIRMPESQELQELCRNIV